MQVASGAVHYVLGLWSRMVAAVPYVRVDTTADPMLDAFVPKVRLAGAQYRHAVLLLSSQPTRFTRAQEVLKYKQGRGGDKQMDCAFTPRPTL